MASSPEAPYIYEHNLGCWHHYLLVSGVVPYRTYPACVFKEVCRNRAPRVQGLDATHIDSKSAANLLRSTLQTYTVPAM
eukprot:6209298-Pleurochrysis_carterae.AAC.3